MEGTRPTLNQPPKDSGKFTYSNSERKEIDEIPYGDDASFEASGYPSTSEDSNYELRARLAATSSSGPPREPQEPIVENQGTDLDDFTPVQRFDFSNLPSAPTYPAEGMNAMIPGQGLNRYSAPFYPVDRTNGTIPSQGNGNASSTSDFSMVPTQPDSISMHYWTGNPSDTQDGNENLQDQPPPTKRAKGEACDACFHSHSRCVGDELMCNRCKKRGEAECTNIRDATRVQRLTAEHILGAVIQSNPALEELIVQELQKEASPGSNRTKLDYLQIDERRPAFRSAFKSSRVFATAFAGGKGPVRKVPKKRTHSTLVDIAAQATPASTTGTAPDPIPGMLPRTAPEATLETVLCNYTIPSTIPGGTGNRILVSAGSSPSGSLTIKVVPNAVNNPSGFWFGAT
ncbi:hypothetical protein F4677DRAFT_443837 [Hypoxylon crocopeplum]|nr:hypothetical protein F4677DRAFT_443837 [Hypoxylon crocopeplum]